jgi:hypothetical protein
MFGPWADMLTLTIKARNRQRVVDRCCTSLRMLLRIPSGAATVRADGDRNPIAHP